MGANHASPDSFAEDRWELLDNITWTRDRHTIYAGSDFGYVRTTESFPAFFPFEADFGCVYPTAACETSMQSGTPFLIFFPRFHAPDFTEVTFNSAIFQGKQSPPDILNRTKGMLVDRYYGVYVEESWRATNQLNLHFGMRYDFEAWPSKVINSDMNNLAPRAGLVYGLGDNHRAVLRAGGGIFYGSVPLSLLLCQIASCGGPLGPYPGSDQSELNAASRIFAFSGTPASMRSAFASLLSGAYPDGVAAPACAGGVLTGCGLFGDAVISRVNRNIRSPYTVQASMGLGFEPFRGAKLEAEYLHLAGIRLSGLFNRNQPDPSGVELFHDSMGRVAEKHNFFCRSISCSGIAGSRDPHFALDLEANSLWHSSYDGLAIAFRKDFTNHFGGGIRYTWSKAFDNAPDTAYLQVPQDNTEFKAERALSSIHSAHDFVADAIVTSPANLGKIINGWTFGVIATFASPRYFTKFAGLDTNGDLLGSNDRVGVEPRNTFKGDSYQTVDLRLTRTFDVNDKLKLQVLTDAFNVLNTMNIRFFNTVYGSADFCPAGGAPACGSGPFFKDGAPNRGYGTPQATFDPRRLQFGIRLTL
jgi:hypothetical protein